MKSRKVWFGGAKVEELARFLVELTKQGAGYVVEDVSDGWLVEVTGF